MAFLDPVFNPLLGPLLNWSPFWGILLLSLLVTLISTLAYKYFTNQSEMKRLKDEQKEFQKKMKELRDKPEELMKLQKEAMSKNFDYMKHSFKPMVITLLPILLIFSWMAANLTYDPISPGEHYSVTAIFAPGYNGTVELIADNGTEILSPATQPLATEVTWNLNSTEGQHFHTIKYQKEQQTKSVLITSKLAEVEAFTVYKDSAITQLRINYAKLKPLNLLVDGELSLFSWQPEWLGIYIITSILFSILLRKVLNVY